MDANKLKVLRDIGYSIDATCGMCEHGEFRTIKDEFGSCMKHSYEHLKHTGDARHLSVFRGGACHDFKMSEAKKGQLGAFAEFTNLVIAGPDHPLWTSFDDDDWNGATCSQWILGCTAKEVVLHPPKGIDAGLLERIRVSIANYATSVEVRS